MDKELREYALQLYKKNRFAPVLVLLRVTKTCNARCVMCNFWKEPSKGYSLEKFKQIVGSAKRLGAKRIRLTGGEPTIWKHFFEALDFISESGLESAFITNGLNMSPSFCKKVAERNVRQVIFSLDSFTPRIHDGLRGVKGGWKKTVKAMKTLSNIRSNHNNPTILVNFVVSNKNFREISDVIEMGKDSLFEEVNLIPIRKVPSLLLSVDEIKNFNKEVVPIIEKRLQESKIGLTSGTPFIFGQSEDDLVSAAKGDYSADFYSKNDCVACKYILFIDSEGNVFPCNNTPYAKELFKAGNVFDEPLEKIWGGKRIQEIRLLAGKSGVCRGCELKNRVFNSMAGKVVAGEEGVF